jgi:hypothetical protein
MLGANRLCHAKQMQRPTSRKCHGIPPIYRGAMIAIRASGMGIRSQVNGIVQLLQVGTQLALPQA